MRRDTTAQPYQCQIMLSLPPMYTFSHRLTHLDGQIETSREKTLGLAGAESEQQQAELLITYHRVK